VADFCDRDEFAARRRLIEVLAEIPGPAVVLSPLLQIATRHVEADCIAEDMIVGLLGVDAPAAFRESNHHLGLIVVVGAFRRVVHRAAARHERVRALDEEKRLLAPVAAHFLLVLGIVAADAENPPYGKGIG